MENKITLCISFVFSALLLPIVKVRLCIASLYLYSTEQKLSSGYTTEIAAWATVWVRRFSSASWECIESTVRYVTQDRKFWILEIRNAKSAEILSSHDGPDEDSCALGCTVKSKVGYWTFGGACCLQLQGLSSSNSFEMLVTNLPVNTVSFIRRFKSSSMLWEPHTSNGKERLHLLMKPMQM